MQKFAAPISPKASNEKSKKLFPVSLAFLTFFSLNSISLSKITLDLSAKTKT